MAIRIPVGKENFDEIRKSGLYYVDKTELLYDLVGETDNEVTLFTRPRRFGKTLNMSMMESFFDINRDSKSVFEGLDIVKHKEFCSEWMNQYPALLYDRNAKPKNYWRNTSGNGVIRTFVGKYKVAGKFETLMNGGAVDEVISDDLTYDIIYESEQNLWSVLLMTGYLTKSSTGESAEAGQLVSLCIPNAEIAGIFRDSVAVYFRETLDVSQQEKMMQALWAGDTDTASEIMSDLLWKTISYMDYHEDYYHAFLAGLFVDRGYETKSNKERGLGRPDLQIYDRDNRRVMIIEAKKSDAADHMEMCCEEALQQIVNEEYAKNLETGYKDVLCYGIAFFRKSAMLKKL